MRKYVFVTLLAMLLFPSSACALSDSEYQELMQTPQFRKADQELVRQWKQTRSVLSEHDWQELLKIQRTWIQQGRDALARELQAAGLSKADAYTVATFRRIGELQVYEYNSHLSGDAMASARADGFYEDEMDQWAGKVIKEAGGNIDAFLQAEQ